MPEFQLDTSGTIYVPGALGHPAPGMETAYTWRILDDFTQGYIEAMFFTATGTAEDGDLREATFANLAPETLASIIADCDKFRDDAKIVVCVGNRDAEAGRDFWYTRNGHGVGFWDGDWPEPCASDLDKAARQFHAVDLYRGDDGKVYLA